MRSKNKIIAGVIIAVLVVSVAVLAGQSDLFQGSIRRIKGGTPKLKQSILYWWKNRVVSAVTSAVVSPVASVVVSNATSAAGASRVASVVVSPVASAIASAVAVPSRDMAGVDTKNLQQLTADMLKSIAKQDYMNSKNMFTSKAKEYYRTNPAKFVLPNAEKEKLIRLYKQKNPAMFIIKK